MIWVDAAIASGEETVVAQPGTKQNLVAANQPAAIRTTAMSTAVTTRAIGRRVAVGGVEGVAAVGELDAAESVSSANATSRAV